MINESILPKCEEVDILLIIEGAYPFIAGGVSTWVQQIIQSYPEWTFGICFLGATESSYKGLKYELPSNLKHVEIHYLFSDNTHAKARHTQGPKKAFEKLDALHDWFNGKHNVPFDEAFKDLDFFIDPKKGITHEDFLYSKCSWHRIVDKYTNDSTEPSFLDYFWAVRNIHQPLWILAQAVRTCVKARVVHAVSTGYAGFLASLLHSRYQYPFILTEHGIYTKERRIELLQARLVKSADPLQQSMIDPNYLMSIWIRFFEGLAKASYGAANIILSLFQVAQAKQIAEGAPADRTRVIANGVNLKKFEPLIALQKQLKEPVIGLIGRVVPIKDIKTFIRAVKVMTQTLPTIKALVIGPEDENPEYAKECHHLVSDLALQGNVQFLGRQNLLDVLPKIRLMVLSSISEGMPLTILEAYAAGVPVVVTKVGACSELVYGFDDASQAIGPAGRVVNISSPHELSTACIELLTEPKQWQAAQAAALRRAKEYFDEKIMIDQYDDIYREALTKWQVLVSN